MDRVTDSGKHETNYARLFTTLIVFCSLLFAVILFQQYLMHQKELENERCQNSKIMYAYPDENGVLVSSEKRPVSAIQRLAESVIYNLYVYEKNSVNENFKAAAKEINPRYAATFASRQSEKAKTIQSQGLSSIFTPQRKYPIRETDDRRGYVYEVTGLEEIYASRTFVEANLKRIEVRMRKIVPTEARPLGVWIDSIKEVEKRKVK